MLGLLLGGTNGTWNRSLVGRVAAQAVQGKSCTVAGASRMHSMACLLRVDWWFSILCTRTMKKTLLTGIAALLLATGTAHATSIARLGDLDLRSA